MVLSQLVFFDSHRNSVLGTKRGLVSFFPLVLILGIIVATEDKKVPRWNKIGGVLLVALVLCSAVAVQLPKDYNGAFVYGALVGLVVGATVSGLTLASSEAPSKLELWSIVILPLITSPLAALTFGLSTKWNLYP
jgi:Na+/citrate or Na+/malate symporter